MDSTQSIPSCPYCPANLQPPWLPGGGHFGGLPSVDYARCLLCGAHLDKLYGGGLAVCVVVPTGAEFPDPWIQTVVVPLMRRCDRARENWREGVYARLFEDAFGFRALPDGWSWTDERRRDLAEAKSRLAASTGEDPDTWAGFALPLPTLPRTPPRTEAWVWAKTQCVHGWVLSDPDATRDLPLPVDPIREDNDAWFAALDTWHASQGYAVPERKEQMNTYAPRASRVRPWYVWSVGGTDVLLGRRKRVWALTFIGLGQRAIADALAPLAKSDAVTFDHDASGVIIHAWSTEKVHEYLAAAYAAARVLPEVAPPSG